jgi:protein-S-isoprenylcysteine O-methyltransferase Ste14
MTEPGSSSARRLIARYRSPLVLALAAIALVAGSRSVSRETLSAVGLILIGAAIARVVDIAQQHGRDAAEEKARRLKDADEVRRLAYTLKIASYVHHPELVASLVNALAHHGHEVPAEEALGHIVDFDTMNPDHPRYEEGATWLQAVIDRITEDQERG